MSGFKDMVADDLARAFIDLDFFGEWHRIEGKEIAIILDSDKLKERQGGQDLAVSESATLFYARKEDLPSRRSPGSVLNVDGRECIIDAWSEDIGMATVVLRENIAG